MFTSDILIVNTYNNMFSVVINKYYYKKEAEELNKKLFHVRIAKKFMKHMILSFFIIIFIIYLIFIKMR